MHHSQSFQEPLIRNDINIDMEINMFDIDGPKSYRGPYSKLKVHSFTN